MDKNEQKKQQYNDYVEQITPKHNLLKNMLCAFLVGGLICVLGQVILNICGNLGLDKDASGSWCSLLLVLLSVVLTGFNIYPKIAKYAGAGTSGADHGLCQLRGGSGHRVPEGRPGFRYRLQDFYDCRAGDSLRHHHELGSGAALLGLELPESIRRQKDGKNSGKTEHPL